MNKYTPEQQLYIQKKSNALLLTQKNSNAVSRKLVDLKNGFEGSVKDTRTIRDKDIDKRSQRTKFLDKVYRLFKYAKEAARFVSLFEHEYSGDVNVYAYFDLTYPTLISQFPKTEVKADLLFQTHLKLYDNFNAGGTVTGSVAGSVAGHAAGSVAGSVWNNSVPNIVQQNASPRFTNIPGSDYNDNRSVPPTSLYRASLPAPTAPTPIVPVPTAPAPIVPAPIVPAPIVPARKAPSVDQILDSVVVTYAAFDDRTIEEIVDHVKTYIEQGASRDQDTYNRFILILADYDYTTATDVQKEEFENTVSAIIDMMRIYPSVDDSM